MSPESGPPLSAPGRFQDFPAGTMLGNFRVVGLLGRGGMGVVYEAEDTLLRRRVALKVLSHPAGQDGGRMLREAQAVARLSHPNVVAIHHVGLLKSGPYLVLELVRGGSLQDRLSAGGPLPRREATRGVAEACRGLAAAHAAGLVHRDVKPGNLMCGEAGAVKVADFGLVRGTSFTATTGSPILGTPDYMSPEQARGDAADERSDLYALGATYFALLVGRPPYAGGGAMQVMFAHCTAPVPDPRDHDPGLPEGCAAVVRKAMAKEPAHRYQTADEMLADLTALAARDETPRVPRKIPSRRSSNGVWVAVVCAVVIVAGGGLVGVVSLMNPGSSAEATRASTEDQKKDELPPVIFSGLDKPFDPTIRPGGNVIQVRAKVGAIAISPDGKWLAVGVTDPPYGVTVWNLQTGEIRRRLKWGVVHSLAFTQVTDPSGPKAIVLAGGCGKGARHWWETPDSEFPYFEEWTEKHGRAASVAFKEGQAFAIGYADGLHQGKVFSYDYRFRGMGDTKVNYGDEGPLSIRQIVYSPCDDLLAMGFSDGRVSVGLASRKEIVWEKPGDMGRETLALAFAPDRPVLAIASGRDLQFWEPREGKKAREKVWWQLPSAAHALAYSPSGKYLAAAGEAGKVTLWDVSSGQLAVNFPGLTGRVAAVAWSPGDRTLVAGGDDECVRLWPVPETLATGK